MSVTLAVCLSVLIYFNTVPYLSYALLFQAHKGQHFQAILKKSDYFENENNLKFTVSREDLPDLPVWLNFEQKDSFSDGILYGTPGDDADTIGLSVVAWNKETYGTHKKVIIVTVSEGVANITQTIEFKVRNKDAKDVMKVGDFVQVVRKIWAGAEYVTRVEKPAQRGDPLGNTEGVFIGIAGNSRYPNELTALKQKCTSVSPSNKIAKNFIDSGYDIDWCSFRNLNKDPASNSPAFDFDHNSNYFNAFLKTTRWDNTREDLTLDIIYVFIAVFVGLLLIVFITCVMFFNREGLQQRNRLTPNEQLLHHKALRRAGAQLRNMSAKDEGNKGFPYGKLDEDSRFGTLSSTKPPASELEGSPSPPSYRHDNFRVGRQDSKF